MRFRVRARRLVAQIPLLMLFASIAVVYQNCAPASFSAVSQTAASSSAATNTNSAGGQIASPSTAAPGVGTITQGSSPAPPVSSAVGCAATQLPTGNCLSSVIGQGTKSAPYEIHSTSDFFCMRQAGTAYWNLKTDLALSLNDIPADSLATMVAIPEFCGTFNGELHQIAYSIDCQSQRCNAPKATWVDKDASLFGYSGGASFANLRLLVDYRHIYAPFKTNPTQYVSGLIGSSVRSLFQRISIRGFIQTDAQVEAGVSAIDAAASANAFSNGNIYDQNDVEYTTDPAHLASIISGVTSVYWFATITNSHVKLDVAQIASGETIGGMSAVNGATPQNNNRLAVSNSWFEANLAMDCNASPSFYPLGGVAPVSTSGALAGVITGQVAVANSFWSGLVTCVNGNTKGYVLPAGYRAPASLATVFTDLQFSPDIWTRNADGTPKLKWLP